MRARLAAFLPAASAALAAGCSHSELDSTPPAAVDPTGVWSGTWTEDTDEGDPATGELVLTLIGDLSGEIEGTSAFGGILCLATHPFQGTVAAFALDGEATQEPGDDEPLVVAFEVDLRSVDAETPSLRGEFRIEVGGDCVGFVAAFQAGLQIEPPEDPEPSPGLTFDPVVRASARATPSRAARVARIGRAFEEAPPAATALAPIDLAGRWTGTWRAEGVDAPVALELAPPLGGVVLGLVTLHGSGPALPRPFAGAWDGSALAGAAFDERSRVELVAWPALGERGARLGLDGRLALELREGGRAVLADLRVAREPSSAPRPVAPPDQAPSATEPTARHAVSSSSASAASIRRW